MLKDTMIGFKKSGLALDDKKLEQFKEIAKQKMPDLNAIDLEGAKLMVEGTARSMGIEIKQK